MSSINPALCLASGVLALFVLPVRGEVLAEEDALFCETFFGCTGGPDKCADYEMWVDGVRIMGSCWIEIQPE